jgi:hypothetical protein
LSFLPINLEVFLFLKYKKLDNTDVPSMRLSHPPDGSTSPKYKLLCFITTKKICKEKNALAFNRDRCCHLVLCLRLIPSNYFSSELYFVYIFSAALCYRLQLEPYNVHCSFYFKRLCLAKIILKKMKIFDKSKASSKIKCPVTNVT